jgi:hypothetical protein
MYQDYETEQDEVLHMNADNEMARWASLDEDLLREDVLELGLEDDLEFLGLVDFDLKEKELKNTNKEIDSDEFDEFKNKCPKCGFEFDEFKA